MRIFVVIDCVKTVAKCIKEPFAENGTGVCDVAASGQPIGNQWDITV